MKINKTIFIVIANQHITKNTNIQERFDKSEEIKILVEKVRDTSALETYL